MLRQLGLLTAFASYAGAAAAQQAPAPPSVNESAASEDGTEESPELRALRLAELEMFGHQEALIELTPSLPRRLRLTLPEALTSDAPLVEPDRGAAGPARDLSWLRELSLPDIPVRWDDRVIRYLEFFRDDPRGQQLIRSWLRRVPRFGAIIRRTLASEGLPEDLIYVAMIESGFDPRARSGAGAVGLWQFVSRTGAEYGLTQNRWVDMRMDPEAATVAGARYLAQLHRRFGSWELALAAYNMGYGALLRAIRKYDTNDFWELSHLEAALPFETNLYVSKIVACAIVARNLERFGLADLAREEADETETVSLPGGTGISIIARAAGVSADEIRRLNPALLRDRLPPGGEHAVRIPAERLAAFERGWARARPAAPLERPYLVRFGETLASIARAHRTTERALRELNQLEEGERIGPGTELLVPAVTVRAEPERRGRVAIAVPPGRFEYTDRRQVFYRTRRSDELEEIARFFAVTIDEIRQWNVIDARAELQDGMFLQLFVPAEVDLARAVVLSPDEVRIMVIGSEEFHNWHARQEGRVRFRVRVEEGDTLSSIASRYGITVGSISRINLIGRDAVLRIGQELIIYTTPDRAPAEVRARFEAEAAEDAASEGEPGDDTETATTEDSASEPEANEEAGG